MNTSTEKLGLRSLLRMPQSAVAGAKPALMLLLAINLFNYIDRQVLAAVVPNIREHFFAHGVEQGPVVEALLSVLRPFFGNNPENALIGLLAMAFMVTYMILAPLFALLPGKRWWIIAAGVIIWSLASGASGLATTFGVLLFTRCLVGVGEAAYGPIAPTMLSDFFDKKVRGQVMAWFYLAIPVGSALGFILGGAVTALLGWQWAFYLVVPPGVLLGLWCLRMREPVSGAAEEDTSAAKKSVGIKGYLALAKNPSFVLNNIGMTAMTFAIGGIGFWMPSYMHEVRGAGGLAEVNMIFGVILVLSGILATMIGGWTADKLQAKYPGSYFLVSGAAMIIGFPFFLGMLYLPFPYAWFCVFGSCFCLFFNTGPTNTILANVTHPSIRASAFALTILITHLFGDVMSPLVVGGLADLWGDMGKSFLVVGAMVLVGGVAWLIGARYLERDTKKALES